jgi:hypothetical protein
MSQTEMLKNEVLEEILRERNNYYVLKKRIIDFWILISPNFLLNLEIKNKLKKTSFFNKYINENDDSIFFKPNEKHSGFFSILVSSDKKFINWIRLRIGFFENLNDLNIENASILDSSLKSNGAYGSFTDDDSISLAFTLKSNISLINPALITPKSTSIILENV